MRSDGERPIALEPCGIAGQRVISEFILTAVLILAKRMLAERMLAEQMLAKQMMAAYPMLTAIAVTSGLKSIRAFAVLPQRALPRQPLWLIR